MTPRIDPDEQPTPEIDNDGYPTEATLERIAQWDITGNDKIAALYEFCRQSWAYQEYWDCGRGFDDLFGRGEKRPQDEYFRVSTVGWSGNESIIDALFRNTMFSGICWLESRRGGHYKFLVRPIAEDGLI